MTMTEPAEQNRAPEQSGAAERSALLPLPLALALACVALVWLGGCAWSFREQSDFALSKGFLIPWLLPLVIDGLAIALAAVSWAASLDGRPALGARLGTAVAVAGSATSNAAFAWQRSAADVATVVLAAAVPIAANLAFEVLLAELRKQVMRRRGIPAPVKIPYPPLLRGALAPFRTFAEWRRLVLAATDMAPLFVAAAAASRTRPERRTPAPAQSRTAEQSTPEPAPGVTPVEPTPARRSAPRRTTPVALHVVASPTAVADAATLRRRYGDALPERGAHSLVQNELGWGGSKATNAIRAYSQQDDRKVG